MMMFPPFFGFNPYYRRGYNRPYNAYVPKEFDKHKFSSSMAASVAKTTVNNPSIFNNNVPTNSFFKNSSTKKNYEVPNKFNFNSDTNNANYSESNVTNDYDKTENSKDECSPFFSIFGIDLYFDDILILALLLFLNTEDVKDSYLYIVLIMLLFN